MIDFGKIYCQQHPGEVLINFCAQKQCSQGLCPTCLCQHTRTHSQNATLPKYENIRNTYLRVHSQIQEQQKLITQDMDRLTAVYSGVHRKKQDFRELLSQAKDECINFVADCFQELGKHWQKEIANIEQKMGLQDQYKLDTLSALIKREMERLIDETKAMNTYGFQERVRRLQSEVLVNSAQFHVKINEQLQENQQYRYNLIYSRDHLKELKESIKKILRLELRVPFKRNQIVLTSPKRMTMSQSMSNFYRQRGEQRTSAPKESISIVIPKRNIVNQSTVQALTLQNNSLLTIPKVLTTSLIQMSPKMESSSATLSTKKCQPIKASEFVCGVDLAKFTKNEISTPLKGNKKKSGLFVMTPKGSESMVFLREKQNSFK